MSVRTSTSTVGSSTVVVVEGVVDLSSIPTLHHDLLRVVRARPGTTVVVDLDAVEALDDAGLGVLLGAAATAREGGGDLEVVCSRAALCGRLASTGFDRAVAVHASIA